MLWMLTADTGRDPVACDIVPADEACPRRLLCCETSSVCWVEHGGETMDCDDDGCAE